MNCDNKIMTCESIGIQLNYEYINDFYEPLIRIKTVSKKDTNILNINIKESKLKSYFRKKIQDVSYKLYDSKKFTLNVETEKIEAYENETIYTIYLIASK